MNSAQTKLYWGTWQAAAKAHGWNSKAGIAAALVDYHAGKTWESPGLNRTLTTIYQLSEFSAQCDVTADDLRHACTVFAVGRNGSSKSFTNADFDRVLALLRLLGDPQNLKNLVAFQDGESGERRRHIHVITQAGAPYWQSIARDRFGHTDLDRLTLAQLRQLSLTIRNRLQAAVQSKGDLIAA